jgi:hypothetical protein
MEKDIFKAALDELAHIDIGIFGPKSFQEYAKVNHFDRLNTRSLISVDFYERLHRSLRKNSAMVFRLGKSTDGRTTNFAIVKVKNRLKDFFLCDKDIFLNKEITTFLPVTSLKKFYQYLILPELSESSFVNLGLASGLIGTAIELDDPEAMIIPATCKSTFTFEFKPHSLLPSILKHDNGQVEIDSIFIEKRNGKESLFLIEAKSSYKREAFNSLAKHKLVYPLLAIYPKIPKDLPIIPIYVKVKKIEDGVSFDLAECEFPNPRKELPTIDQLKVVRCARYFLPLNFSKLSNSSFI